MKLYTSDALGDHMKDPDGKTSSLTDRHEQTTHFCRGSVRGPRGPFCQHLRRPVFGKRRSCCKPCGVDSSFLTRKQSTPKTNCCKSAEESVWTAAEGKNHKCWLVREVGVIGDPLQLHVWLPFEIKVCVFLRSGVKCFIVLLVLRSKNCGSPLYLNLHVSVCWMSPKLCA